MTAAYIIASLALIVKPGPDLMFLFATALSEGRPRAFALMAGQILGCWLWILLLTAGAAAFFAGHPRLVSAVQILGVGYIAYIAFGTVREYLSERKPNRDRKQNGAGMPAEETAHMGKRGFFVRGVLMAMANPLTILFFMAFLPTFTVSGSVQDTALRTFALGTLFCALVPLVDVPMILAVDFFRARLVESARTKSMLKLLSAAILWIVVALLAIRAIGGMAG